MTVCGRENVCFYFFLTTKIIQEPQGSSEPGVFITAGNGKWAGSSHTCTFFLQSKSFYLNVLVAAQGYNDIHNYYRVIMNIN